jgi:hypothetical protein
LFLVVRFIVGVFSFYLFSSVIHGKISLHWRVLPGTDLLFLVPAAHLIPSLGGILKLELFWFCRLSLYKTLQCGCNKTKSVVCNFMAGQIIIFYICLFI